MSTRKNNTSGATNSKVTTADPIKLLKTQITKKNTLIRNKNSMLNDNREYIATLKKDIAWHQLQVDTLEGTLHNAYVEKDKLKLESFRRRLNWWYKDSSPTVKTTAAVLSDVVNSNPVTKINDVLSDTVNKAVEVWIEVKEVTGEWVDLIKEAWNDLITKVPLLSDENANENIKKTSSMLIITKKKVVISWTGTISDLSSVVDYLIDPDWFEITAQSWTGETDENLESEEEIINAVKDHINKLFPEVIIGEDV